jgi:enamine deaminase RidA (YjgF/YER057c/UK114 family)
MRNVELVLAAAGASFADVVKMTTIETSKLGYNPTIPYPSGKQGWVTLR